MAKGSGTTRGSASNAPRGLQSAQIASNGLSARMSSRISTAEENALQEKLGNSFALPVYEFSAREYQEATGKQLPDDAVRIVFGRGAANGADYYETLNTPKYSNMKSENVTIGSGNSAKDVTYLSGYQSFEQLRDFIKDVNAASWRTRYESLQRRWNQR